MTSHRVSITEQTTAKRYLFVKLSSINVLWINGKYCYKTDFVFVAHPTKIESCQCGKFELVCEEKNPVVRCS